MSTLNTLVAPKVTIKKEVADISICEVCQQNERKYTCPGCQAKTCSLSCVKVHKQARRCDGKRKLIDFVKLDNFTDKNLLDDIQFLESTSRKIKGTDGALAQPRYSSANAHCSRTVLAKLCKAASMRNIQLKLSPFLTTRRKANSTYCNSRNAQRVNERTKMFWHIRWVWDSHHFEHRSVDENIILHEALQQLIDSAEMASEGEMPVAASQFLSSLRSYKSSNDDTLHIGMLAEHLKQSNAIYLLNDKLSLRDNLNGKTIIEHPIFIVIPSKNLADYHQIY